MHKSYNDKYTDKIAIQRKKCKVFFLGQCRCIGFLIQSLCTRNNLKKKPGSFRDGRNLKDMKTADSVLLCLSHEN